MPPLDIFPTLQSCTRLASGDCIFDVKFYPYATQHDDQIFAFVAEENTVVCRPKLGADPPYEILRWFKDDQSPKASFNSLAWTKDPITRKPWLCVAGSVPKHIKILDIETGDAVRTLSGHGKGINDLAISPLSTSILASGAEDNSIRLWNLEHSHRKQPCVALLSGEGHKAPVLAVHFHPNGKWLLSGGIDTAVCLWAVPALDELQRKVDNDGTAEAGESKIVYYPHFFTKELHSNYVDCLSFYGDLIISRAARDQKDNRGNQILIWKIDGFDSDDPPREHPPIPIPGRWTRSSFPHEEGFRGFQRLVTLSMNDTDRFYHRFGLYHAPGRRPILAMGNQQSAYLFWDLQRLDDGLDLHDPNNKAKKNKGSKKAKNTASTENLYSDRRLDLPRSESVAEGTGTSSNASTSIRPGKSTPDDRFTPIPPHHKRTIDTTLSSKVHFATSQIAWSPDGTWMVGVGDFGMMCMFHREKSAVEAVE